LLREPTIRVALISLILTFTILSARIIAFIISNSLVVLADTFHSIFDIIAGIIAIYALKTARKPPDEEHTYGHGKAENLGALYEATSLILVCILIFYEAINRLFFKEISEVNYNLIVLSIVSTTLIIDIWRSYVLKKAAKRYSSQVLEGDSLHYLSDAAITASVLGTIIVGMIFFKGSSVVIFDSTVAFFIASYFIYSGIRLAKKSIEELLDRAPPGVIHEINAAIKEFNCIPLRVRARKSGSRLFIDSIVCIPKNLTASQAHELAEIIERKLRTRLNYKEIDMVIHMEPLLSLKEDEIKREIQKIVSDLGISAHNVMIEQSGEKYDVRLHAEIPAKLNLDEAHDKITILERKIREDIREVEKVIIHIEPYREIKQDITEIVKKILIQNPKISQKMSISSVLVSNIENKTYLDLICNFSKDMNIEEVHKLTASFESLLREILGDDIIITIHQEPV